MKAQNNTPYIFVYGGVQIPPGQQGDLPEEARERLAHFFANRRLVEISPPAPMSILDLPKIESRFDLEIDPPPQSEIDTLEGLIDDVGDVPESPPKRRAGRPKKGA